MEHEINTDNETKLARDHNNDFVQDDVSKKRKQDSAAQYGDDNDSEVVSDDELAVARERIAQLERELSLNQKQTDESKNEYLRARADAENYRKRIEREKADSIRFANNRILLDVINVLDNFERALTAVEKTAANETLFDGVELIKKEWVSTLENNWGVSQIETTNQPFDPQLHEAVAIEEDEHATEECIGEEFQKGYLLHARVLRPAKVKVIKPTQDKV